MNWSLPILALLLLACGFFAWRYFTLRRGLHEITNQIKRGDDPTESSSALGELASAIGETMIVAVAAGAGPNFTFNPFQAAETMTGHIARISGGDLSYNSIDYNSLFAIALMLFLVTLVLNLISQWVVSRFRERYE